MSVFGDSHVSTGTFTVPALEEYGATTMRVRNIYGDDPSADPCDNYFGEVEDYTIQLRQSGSVIVDLDEDGFFSDVDCDDNNPDVNPDAMEIPNNDIDEDCDGADLTTSTHEIANSIVNFYPNPASTVINIEVFGELNFRTRLYDLQGKIVAQDSNNALFRIAVIPAGLYLLEVEDVNSGIRIIERVVVER